ncbi:ABC transporter permease subunit [Aerococcaceae bacterium DSM 109653]|uniref:Maltodextrin transport system permease protein MalC n=1 Tax=Fundicoccus ignavus TaxID=2664442 RepID=A0A6I2GR03_9LACT|nr:sugar ABC transporter permease [Fundicoccus ignavus]MRI80921.1 ABC transporter permease subunit [Fundicoccus ignavus]MRI85875.1 ABC transporter permease subunit [Fundicoccus ignavus]
MKDKQAPISAMLSLIPGLGQLFNRQYIKGFVIFSLFTAFMLVFSDFFQAGIWGFVTLGTEVPRDNSIFLLSEGLVALIIISVGLVFYILNIRDAYVNGQRLSQGKQVNSIRGTYHAILNEGYPYLLTGPAFFVLLFSVVFPILFTISLAFTNYDLYHSAPANLADWVGFETFKKIFSVDIWRNTFVNVLGWTVVWTLVASTLQVSVGILLAIIVNQKKLKAKKFIRTIFMLPWAVPGFVTILIFAGLFNDSFGAINNQILASVGIGPISWMTDPNWTRIALLLIQTWLGFPYIFLVTTGTLQSIPDELYEASVMDGASAWQKFKQITLPIILYSMTPIIITQYTFNFNNFNIIYLFNGGGPAVLGSNAGGTDILVSWIYKLTMQNSQYALAAALTILLSVFVIFIALWQFRRSNSFKEVQ